MDKIEHLIGLADSSREELLKVWEASVRSSHHFLCEEDILFYRARVHDIYLEGIDIYVVRQNGKLVAFMGLSDDMVEMLFVHPSAKGKGIGSALLGFASENRGILKVDVNEQNTEAYEFYLKRGYKVIDRADFDADGRPFPILHMLLSPVDQ